MTLIQQAIEKATKAQKALGNWEEDEAAICIAECLTALRSIKPATEEEMVDAVCRALCTSAKEISMSAAIGFSAAERFHGIGVE